MNKKFVWNIHNIGYMRQVLYIEEKILHPRKDRFIKLQPIIYDNISLIQAIPQNTPCQIKEFIGLLQNICNAQLRIRNRILKYICDLSIIRILRSVCKFNQVRIFLYCRTHCLFQILRHI